MTVYNKKWHTSKKEWVRDITHHLNIQWWDAGRIYDKFEGDEDLFDWKEELWGLSWSEKVERMNLWRGRNVAEEYDGPDEDYYMEQQELWLEQQLREEDDEDFSEFESSYIDKDCHRKQKNVEPQKWIMDFEQKPEYETTIEKTAATDPCSFSWEIDICEQSTLVEDDHPSDETKVIVEDWYSYHTHGGIERYLGKVRSSLLWVVGSNRQYQMQSMNQHIFHRDVSITTFNF